MAGTANIRDPQPCARARAPFAAAVLVFAALALGALAAITGAAACLPDLSAISGEDSPFAPPFVGCGDGIIATLDDGGDAGESCDPGKPGAQPLGCKSCRVECDGTLDPATNHCYFAAGADKTYNAALTTCAAFQAHVVTFASRAEVALVEGIPHDPSAGFWVGLSRNPTLEAYEPARAEEPGFPYPPSGPCDGCFGVGADSGVFPIADVDASSPSCLASRDGGWSQVECEARGATAALRTTICEREPLGIRATDCIGGFCFTLASTAGKKAYLVAVSAADPDQAAQNCAALDGGSLVLLESPEEREQLAHEILARGRFVRDPDVKQELWIGLVAADGGGSWDDGIPAVKGGARPLPWGNAEPTGSGRAVMRLAATAAPAYDTQLAHADGGRAPQLYVCQRPP